MVTKVTRVNAPKRFLLGFTEAEHRAVKVASAVAGQTMEEYMRGRILHGLGVEPEGARHEHADEVTTRTPTHSKRPIAEAHPHEGISPEQFTDAETPSSPALPIRPTESPLPPKAPEAVLPSVEPTKVNGTNGAGHPEPAPPEPPSPTPPEGEIDFEAMLRDVS